VLVAFLALTLGQTAQGKSSRITIPSHKHLTLQQTIKWQHRIIRHDLWVIRTARVHRSDIVSWHRKQLVWTRRELKQSLDKLTPPIAHHTLWMCIHGLEGNWDDPNSGHNGHYGGLQMHPGWGYGTSYYANNDSQYTQELAAERGYRASGFSKSWLMGQWNHPQCLNYS
jgi:hypothetical protein